MVKAKKHFGQNFLQDEEVLEMIIEAAELKENEQVLEIGPGRGALTKPLLQSGIQLTAVEYDADLIPFLEKNFGENDHFHLIHDDALTFTPPKGDYKIVANIPYYITSPLINHYLFEQFLKQQNEEGNPPTMIVFMVQKEVAEKILAKKGKHSVLSLQVHLFGDPELICTVPKEAFNPMPKVDSAVIKIRIQKKAKIDENLKKLFWLFHVSFAQKRKKLANNLGAALQKKPAEIKIELESIGIDPNIRAEALTLEEWEKLYKNLKLDQENTKASKK